MTVLVAVVMTVLFMMVMTVLFMMVITVLFVEDMSVLVFKTYDSDPMLVSDSRQCCTVSRLFLK